MGGRYRVQSTKYDTIYVYSRAGERSRSAIRTAFCFPCYIVYYLGVDPNIS